jgi:hypothetical protein
MVFCRLACQDSEFGCAHVAQLAEHVLGKDEVISSILIMGSILDCKQNENDAVCDEPARGLTEKKRKYRQ